MPELAVKEKCCGCAACYSICKKDAIFMKADISGFLFPEIDSTKCINCRQCDKVCPAINKLTHRETFSPRAYVGQHKDEQIRNESTSGGIFTAIAETIIDKNGVVFGATMTDAFEVVHKYVETKEDLASFRNSKYVQSKIGNCYRECKTFLDAGRWVCFSGTPCQIEGLLQFLKKEYSQLITVDIVCHSVPSPLIFRKYVELQKNKYPQIKKFVFRDKAWGYSYSTMALYDEKDCVYRNGSESDLWFRSFLPGLCDRENCYSCAYQEWPRFSDITIWDCFAISKIYKEFDDNKGTTSIMVWSSKGQYVIDQFKESTRIVEVSPDLFKDKIFREYDKKLNVDRKQLYIDAASMPPEEFFNKYRPNTTKVKLEKIAKRFLHVTHLYNIVKNASQQIWR